jgi:hypothetical protein
VAAEDKIKLEGYNTIKFKHLNILSHLIRLQQEKARLKI